MGVMLGSACGTRSSAETMHDTHVLDPAQNIIKMCIIKKMNNE
jgi:hypothetical protein